MTFFFFYKKHVHIWLGYTIIFPFIQQIQYQMPALDQELSCTTLKVQGSIISICTLIIVINFISTSCHSWQSSVILNYILSIPGYCSYLKEWYTKWFFMENRLISIKWPLIGEKKENKTSELILKKQKKTKLQKAMGYFLDT